MATLEIRSKKNFLKFKNNFKVSKRKVLFAIGERWKTLATKLITQRKIIDTGQLRRSVGYNVKKDYIDIGSPMDYAKYVEEQRKGGFLKDSAMMLQEDITKLAVEIIRQHIR